MNPPRRIVTQNYYYVPTPERGNEENLVDDYRKYKYSSAGFHELEDYQGYEVDHYLKVM